jgi:hypothetical protein
MNGEQYCGNNNEMEVHDLDNEKADCQIDEIIDARHDVPFDDLESAQKDGYDNCHWCIGGSTG